MFSQACVLERVVPEKVVLSGEVVGSLRGRTLLEKGCHSGVGHFKGGRTALFFLSLRLVGYILFSSGAGF